MVFSVQDWCHTRWKRRMPCGARVSGHPPDTTRPPRLSQSPQSPASRQECGEARRTKKGPGHAGPCGDSAPPAGWRRTTAQRRRRPSRADRAVGLAARLAGAAGAALRTVTAVEDHRLVTRHQVPRCAADQVVTAHGTQGFTDQRPAFRIVVAQQGLVQAALAAGLGRVDGFGIGRHLAQRVLARVVMVVAMAIGVGMKVCT